MPTAVTELKNRLAADRRRAVSFVLLTALHLTAFAILLWSEDEPAARGFPAHLGRSQFFLARPAATPADLGSALAGADCDPDRVVAVQAQRADDDGDLRRRDAHRLRHVPVLHQGQFQPSLEAGARHCVDNPAMARSLARR